MLLFDAISHLAGNRDVVDLEVQGLEERQATAGREFPGVDGLVGGPAEAQHAHLCERGENLGG